MNVTVSISDAVLETAKQLADKAQQPLDEFLANQLAQAVTAQALNTADKNDPVDQETAAFRAQHPQLWQQYPHHYVAMIDGQVVDHDQDDEALSERIHLAFPDRFVLIRLVDHEAEKTIYISPQVF